MTQALRLSSSKDKLTVSAFSTRPRRKSSAERQISRSTLTSCLFLSSQPLSLCAIYAQRWMCPPFSRNRFKQESDHRCQMMDHLRTLHDPLHLGNGSLGWQLTGDMCFLYAWLLPNELSYADSLNLTTTGEDLSLLAPNYRDGETEAQVP